MKVKIRETGEIRVISLIDPDNGIDCLYHTIVCDTKHTIDNDIVLLSNDDFIWLKNIASRLQACWDEIYENDDWDDYMEELDELVLTDWEIYISRLEKELNIE